MDNWPEEERALVARARHGDTAAFAVLARHHAPVALRVATGICGSVPDAEDALQEGLLKAYRALDGFRAESPLRPWLVRIVANEARNRRRAAGRRLRLVERVGAQRSVAVTAAPPELEVLADLESRELWNALGRLDERDRTIVCLRYFAGFNEGEMADALGCPAGTVKSRLSRALGRLRPLLDAEVDRD